MDDFSPDKVLVTVGRARDLAEFAERVSSLLYDNFTLSIAAPLEDHYGADGNIRFIGFVIGTEVQSMTMENQAAKLSSTGGVLNGRVYENMEEAVTDAKKRYDFDDGSEALAARNEKLKELIRRFPRLSADEVQFGSIFDALMTTGRLTLIRGLLDDEPVCILTMISENEAGTALKFEPMAILITSPTLAKSIELPFPT